MTETSNTGRKQANKGQFKKGDPRINRRGRPTNFDSWRALVQAILSEPAVSMPQKDGGGKPKLFKIQIPKTVDGKPVLDENGDLVMIDHYATNAEVLARSWLRDAKRQQALTEAAYGKVPQNVDLTSGGKPLSKMSDDELIRLITARIGADGGGDPGGGTPEAPNSEPGDAE